MGKRKVTRQGRPLREQDKPVRYTQYSTERLGVNSATDLFLTDAACFKREQYPHYRVFAVDQRNHGHSPHALTMSYPEMAEDLREFPQAHELSSAYLLVHSMAVDQHYHACPAEWAFACQLLPS